MAEHVASLPVDQAAEALLPHLWYDPDWEYAAPAALAMHPQHDQLLRDLICRAARSDQIPGDLSVIDAGWQVRGLLARVAAESSEADWSPEIAGMIGQARVELAQSGRFGDLGGAAHWGTSNRQARDALLGLLARETDSRGWPQTAGGRRWSSSTRRRRTSARPATRCSGCWPARPTAGMAAELAGGAGPARPDGGGQAPGPRRAARAAGPRDRQLGGRRAGGRAVAQLDPTAEDKRQARDALLGLLARETDSWVAAELAGALAQLDPTAEDKRQAREALLGLLARETDSWVAAELAGGLARSTRRRRTGARPATRCSGCWPARPTAGWPQSWRARWARSTRRRRTGARPATRCSGCWPADRQLAGRRAGGRAGPARPDGGGQAPGPRRAARAAGPRDRQLGWPQSWRARWARSTPTAEDRRQARDALLGRLAGARPTSGMAAELAARAGPARPDGGGQAPGPRRAARRCWPARRRQRDGPQSWRRALGTSSRPDGGGQAPGPRRAARAAGPRDRQRGGRRAGGRAGPARPDSPRPQNMARLGGPTDRRTACCGAPELGTYQLACSPPLADLALRFTRLRHRTRQPQSRPRTSPKRRPGAR